MHFSFTFQFCTIHTSPSSSSLEKPSAPNTCTATTSNNRATNLTASISNERLWETLEKKASADGEQQLCARRGCKLSPSFPSFFFPVRFGATPIPLIKSICSLLPSPQPRVNVNIYNTFPFFSYSPDSDVTCGVVSEGNENCFVPSASNGMCVCWTVKVSGMCDHGRF